jgi:hypothetical protein
MKTTNRPLTASLLSALSAGPAEADALVSRIGLDASRRNDVARELAELCSESRATFSYPTIMQMYEIA